MPWKECSVMDERLRCVAKLLEGEAMTDVCREFGISRKTGYKIFQRYQAAHQELTDLARTPMRLLALGWGYADPGQEHHPRCVTSARAGQSAPPHHQATRCQSPPAAGQIRGLHPRVQL